MRRVARRLLPRELHSLSGNSHQPVNHPVESPHSVTSAEDVHHGQILEPRYDAQTITYEIVRHNEAERVMTEMEAVVEHLRRDAEAQQEAAARLLAEELEAERRAEMLRAQQAEQARIQAEQQAQLQAQQTQQRAQQVKQQGVVTPASQPITGISDVSQQFTAHVRPTIHIIKAHDTTPEHIRPFDADRRAPPVKLMTLVPTIAAERRRLASDPATLAQFERELEAKQEKERMERERWMASHNRKLEPPVILTEEEKRELAQKREAALVEAKRIAIEQARIEQEAKARREAEEAAAERRRQEAAAEAERVRQAAAAAAEKKRLAEQAAREKAAAELAKFNEVRRVQELKDRELSARIAQEVEKSLEAESHKQYDNIIITQKNMPARASVVVQSPPAPPTPPIQPIVVNKVPSTVEPPEHRPASERMVPYALILVGGALLYWHFTKEPLEVPVLTDAPIVSTSKASVTSPLATVPVPENDVTISKLTEKKRSVEPVKVAPVEVTVLPPVPQLPVVDFSHIDVSSMPSSDRELAALMSAADSLSVLHMQQQYALISKLESEDNMSQRQQLREMIDQNAARFAQRIKELKSGVEVHMDSPVLTMVDHQALERASNDELRQHAAALKKQLAVLQSMSGKAQDVQHAVDNDDDTTDASVSDPAVASSRARTQTLTQMANAISTLKQDMEREYATLADRLLEAEAAGMKLELQIEQKRFIDQAVEDAQREERLQLKAVEADELATQRREIEEWATELFLEQREAIEEQNDQIRAQRLDEINAAHQRLKAFFQVFNEVGVDADQSQNLHQLSLSLLALASIMNAGHDASSQQDLDRMLQRGWSRLHQVRSSDPIIDAALTSIPASVISNGLPTAHTLSARWRRVKDAMRAEAFVPVGAKADERSLWAHLTGKVFSLFYITQEPASITLERSADEMTNDLTSIDLLDAMVRARDWNTIVQFESSLSDHVRAFDRDWVAQVRDRAVTELALEAIQARVICLAAQM